MCVCVCWTLNCAKEIKMEVLTQASIKCWLANERTLGVVIVIVIVRMMMMMMMIMMMKPSMCLFTIVSHIHIYTTENFALGINETIAL